jgi:hypothetical protein
MFRKSMIIKIILWRIRRTYYLIFKRDYIERQIKNRRKRCGGHGCCDVTPLDKFINAYVRGCLDKKDRTKCLRWKEGLKWNNLPFSCYSYPFDKKDIYPTKKNICNFWKEER